jgi:TP901 family phage tail tape measure protein
MKSASSVFTYRDVIVQLHESLQGGSSSLTRYANDVTAIATAMRSAQNEAASLSQALADLNMRGMKMGKLKEATQGVATPTPLPQPEPATAQIKTEVTPQVTTPVNVAATVTDALREEIKPIVPLEIIQPVDVTVQVQSEDTSDLKQVVEDVSATETVIMATVDTAEAESQWADLKALTDEMYANVIVTAETEEATVELKQVEELVSTTLPEAAKPIKVEVDTSGTQDQFQSLLDDLDKLGSSGNEIASTFATTARTLEQSIEGTREAFNEVSGSAQKFLTDMGGELFQNLVAKMEEFERTGEATVEQVTAMNGVLDQLKQVGQSFGNEEIVGWATMAKEAMDELTPAIKIVDEQAEALKKQQEEAAKVAEQEVNALQKLRRELDPIPVQLEQLAQKEKEWAQAMQEGKITAESYAAGLKKLAEDRERLNKPPDQGGGGGGGGGDGADPATAIASGLLQVAGVATGVAAMKEAVSMAQYLEAALVKVQNATGATDEEMKSLKATLGALGEEFGNSKLEEDAAMLEIVSRGYRDVAEATEVLRAANQLADATFSDVGQSAASLSQIMSAFSIDASKAQDAAATLAVASRGNAEAMSLMATTAGRLGPEMANAGLGVEDFAIAVGTLSETAGGSRGVMKAMSGLSQLITKLTRVTPELTSKFKEHGLVINASRVANEGLGTVLKEIYEKTGGNKQALEDLLGPGQSVNTLLSLMKDNGAAWAKVAGEMTDKMTVMEKFMSRVNETATKLSSDLKNKLTNRLIEVGTQISNLLVPALEFLNRHVDALFNLLATATAIVTFNSAIALASKAVKMLGIDLAASALATEGAMGKMATAAMTGATKIKAAFNGLGLAIIAGIVAYDIASALREWIMKSVPAFDDYTALVVTYFIEMFQQIARAAVHFSSSLTNILTGGLGVIKDVTGRVIVNIGEMFRGSKIFGFLADDMVAFGESLRKDGQASMAAYTAAVDANTESYTEAINKTRAYREELKASIEWQNSAAGAAERAGEATKAHGEAAEEAAAKIATYALSAEQLARIDQVIASDPANAIRKQAQELRDFMETVAGASNAPAEKMAAFTAAANRQLAELGRAMESAQVAAEKLAMEKTPMESFLEGIAAAASPAAAALQQLDAKVKALDEALRRGLMSEEEYQKEILAAVISYDEASRAGGEYEKRLKAIRSEMDPAAVAIEDYAAKIENAQKMLAGDPEALAAYMRVAEANHNRNLQLIALEQDGLIQLTAQYDPLIANEVARTKALIEMESLLSKASLSEQERAEWATKASQVINEQYDRQAREIQGNITLADAWKKAWESAIERIDGSFAELWKSAFDGMDSFKEQIKDTFKQLIAEIAHARITRPMIAKIGEIFSGQPKPGEVFGGGLTGDIMKRVMGVKENPAGVMATHSTAVRAIEEGTYKGFQRAMAGTGGTGLLGDTSGVMDGLEEISVWAEKIGGEFGDIGGKIEEAMNSISLDGLTDGLQGAFGSALEKYFPMIGNAQQAGGVLGGAGGGGGITQYLSQIPGIGKMLQGMGQFGATLSAFGTAFKGGLSTWLSGGGYSSMSQVALGTQSGVAGWGSMAGQAVGGAAVGYAGGYVTNQLLGGRGDATRNGVLSTVGGVIGSLWGPVGSLVGGAIGSLVDNIIGGGQKIKDFGYEFAVEGGKVMGDFYTKIKKYGSWFSSSTSVERESLDRWNPVLRAMQEAFKQTRDMLLGFAEELGGSTEAISNFTGATIKISTKGKSDTEVQAEIEQAQLDMAGKQIQAYLGAASRQSIADIFSEFRASGAEGMGPIFRLFGRTIEAMQPTARVDTKTEDILPSEFRTLLNTFLISGKDLIAMNPELKKAGDTFKNSMHYTKEFIAAFQQLATLAVAINLKPSVDGLEAYKKANATATEQYYDLVDAAQKVYEQFDGTIESITSVTEAFVAQRAAAVQLAAALYQVKEEITKMFADTALSIRESLMAPQELYDFRKQRTEDLAAQLTTVTDPAKLQQISSEINSLVNSLYQSLDDTQRQAMAPEFLTFLDGVSEIVDQQTQAGLSALDASATSVNDQLSAAMLAGMERQGIIVAQQAESTAQFANAVGVFARAAETIASWSGRTPSAPAASVAPNTTVATSSTRSTGGGFSGLISRAAREVNA